MYVVIEMQNGIVGEHAWTYDTREDAEVKLFNFILNILLRCII